MQMSLMSRAEVVIDITWAQRIIKIRDREVRQAVWDNTLTRIKAVPVTGREDQLIYKTSMLTHFPDVRFTDGGDVVLIHGKTETKLLTLQFPRQYPLVLLVQTYVRDRVNGWEVDNVELRDVECSVLMQQEKGRWTNSILN
jgi:hypothetical protein